MPSEVVQHARRQALSWRFWMLETALALAVAMLGSGIFWLARSQPPIYARDLRVNVADRPFDLAGMHAAEDNGAFRYSWTSGHVLLQIPNAFNAAPQYRVSMRLRSAAPGGAQPLALLANERPITTVVPSSTFQTIALVAADPGEDDRALRIELSTPTFSTPGDPRALGVMMTDIEVQPLRSVRISEIASLCALAAGLWLWLRSRQVSRRLAVLLCGLLLGVFAVLYGRYIPAPLALPWRAAAATATIALAALLTRSSAGRLGLAALGMLMCASGMIWPSWLTDDAFISFRYAQNLVAGNGLVYNPGERVEGFTNFLWTIMAAGVLRLGGDIVFWSYMSCLLLGLAIVLLSFWLGQRLIAPPWALCTAFIVGTSQSVLVYSGRGSGLETALFTLLVLAAVACALSPRAPVWCGIFFALATLTRPEGILLLALTVGYLWFADHGWQRPNAIVAWRTIQGTLPLLAAYLTIVVPFFLWRYNYYGEWLPNTFYAKTGGGLQQVPRGFIYAGRFALSIGGPIALLGLLPFLSGWRAALLSWRGYMLLLIGVYTAYIVAVGGDHFPGDRFFVPVVPWLALSISDGLAWLYTRSAVRARVVAPLGIAGILVLVSVTGLFRGNDFNNIIRGDDESLGIWSEIGWWMHDHAMPDESIAAMGAGAVAYYSDRTTIDLLGLNDKHIARVSVATIGSGTAGHEKRDPDYVLNIRHPNYIPQIWDDYFGGASTLQKNYSLIRIQTRYGRELSLWKRNS